MPKGKPKSGKRNYKKRSPETVTFATRIEPKHKPDLIEVVKKFKTNLKKK